METKKQKQIGELVRRNIGIILQEEGSYIYGDVLVTVTNVVVSPDMGQAKVYISIYNTENKQAVILQLEENIVRLRQALAFRIKKLVRRIPEIHFYIDDTLDEMFRLNSIFDKLEKENQMGRHRVDEEEDK